MDEFYKLDSLGTYFINLIGFSKGKGSYKIFYDKEYSFKDKLNYLKKRLKDEGYIVYKVSKRQKAYITNFARRVYFKKEVEYAISNDGNFAVCKIQKIGLF